MDPASSLYHFPCNVVSYLVVFYICMLVYLLFAEVSNSSSPSTISTSTVLSHSISCTFNPSTKGSVSPSLSLSSSMTTSSDSSTIAGTPVIPVVMWSALCTRRGGGERVLTVGL